MGNYIYSLILLSLINIFFALYTWRASKGVNYIKYFAGSLLSVGLWGVGLAAFLGSTNPDIALLWAKFHYVASIFVAYYLLLFALSFSKSTPIGKIQNIVLLIPIIAVSVVTIFFNDLLLKDVIIENSGNVAVLFKPGHIAYGVIFTLYFAATLFIFFLKTLNSSGIVQKQVILVFIGLLVSGILGAVYNLILPILGNYKLIWVGPQFTLIFLFLMFLAIIRYQLFNIRLLLGKISFIVTTSILMFLSFLFFVFLLDEIFDRKMSLEYIVFGIFCAVVFVSLYEKYREYILNNIQSRIISPGFDANIVLKQYNNEMGKVSSKSEVLNSLANTIKRTLHPEYISIITREGSEIINRQYTEYRNFDYKYIFEKIQRERDLINRKNIAIQTILGTLQAESSESVVSLKEFMSLLEKNDIQILFPIAYEGELLAVCLLGKMDRFTSVYTPDDIGYVESLINSTAVFLTRTILSEQLKNFNITLQQKVDEQAKDLRLKVQELEEARKKENDMIDIMGHELRTPATVVKLNVELLNKYIDSNPEGFKKYLDRIRRAVETEIGLINTLLTSAKLEGSKVEIGCDKIDIKKEIEMAVHGHEYELKEKGLEFINRTEEYTPPVYADGVRVAEILNNLLSNAIKYTQKGHISIYTKHDDKFVTVVVEDTGKGIPEDRISVLGKKFGRVDNYLGSEIVRPGGTGLGLYVTFGLVKLMGGDIWIDSKIGKGSSFSFTLPIFNGQSISPKGSDNMFEKLGLKK